jgi:hypothetical protein
MDNRFTRLLLVLAVAIAPTGAPLTAPVALGQDMKPSAPAGFKVYSPDGRESLTASCRPVGPAPLVNEVTCTFVRVRFTPPEERPGKTDTPRSIEETLTKDPRLAEEFRSDPKAFERELSQRLETARRDFCAFSSTDRVAVEARMREPATGPKRHGYYQRLLAACADRDPKAFFSRMSDLDRRTCGLWVDHFTLGFGMVREGHWRSRPEAPGLPGTIVNVYELWGDGVRWTLFEAHALTDGAEQRGPARTGWNWENVTEYELPCEFVSHRLIRSP